MKVIVGVALLSAVVAVSAMVIRGATWLFFGHWIRGAATAAVLALLLVTGTVSIGGIWGWLQDQWAENIWVTLGILVLAAWPACLVASGIGGMWSSPAPTSPTERCPSCGYGAHGGAPCASGPRAA